MLDIGPGNGTATLAWARDHPTWDVLALELHRPGLAQLVRRLDAEGPSNVRVAELDAVVLVAQLPVGAIEQVRILFPDPWPKRRHHRRRMVDHLLVARIADLLPVGGRLHLATDWPDYADQMRNAIAAETRLTPITDGATEPWISERPDRPVTAYEQRAAAAGRPVTDLVAVRTER